MAVVAGLALGAQSMTGPGRAQIKVTDPAAPSAKQVPKKLDQLPVSTGKGPSVGSFLGNDRRPDGPSTVMAPAQGKQKEQLFWITKNAHLAFAERAAGKGDPRVFLSYPLRDIPAQGLYGQTVYSDYSVDQPERATVRTFIVGLVRGPVTKVLIDLPGGSVPAHLAPAENPDLGSVYWLVTDAFDSTGAVTAAAANPAFGKDTNSIGHTVYRGSEPVFYRKGTPARG